MTIHFLDFIMYIVLVGVIWKALEVISGGELTEELGGIVGLIIILVFTIIYVILFVFCDYNWVDIFNESWIKFKL